MTKSLHKRKDRKDRKEKNQTNRSVIKNKEIVRKTNLYKN